MTGRKVITARIVGWMVTWHDGYNSKLVRFNRSEFKDAVKYQQYRYGHNPSRSDVKIIPIYEDMEGGRVNDIGTNDRIGDEKT